LVKQLQIADPRLKIARYMDPVSKNALIAVREALAEAAVSGEQLAADPCGYGLVVGATRGACVTREGLYTSLTQRQGRMVSGTLFSHCGYNVAGAMTAIAYGLKGPNLTMAARGDAGLPILRRARQFLLSGRAHTMLAGFTESGGVLKRASRLFHEIAYFLCLEKLERARSRGARILAEVLIEDDGRILALEHGGPIYGLQSPCLEPGAANPALDFPLPGLEACGDGYRSLIMLGLLAYSLELRQNFAGVAFGLGTGRASAMIRLIFGRAETAS
jgi:hypothetical protein